MRGGYCTFSCLSVDKLKESVTKLMFPSTNMWNVARDMTIATLIGNHKSTLSALLSLSYHISKGWCIFHVATFRNELSF